MTYHIFILSLKYIVLVNLFHHVIVHWTRIASQSYIVDIAAFPFPVFVVLKHFTNTTDHCSVGSALVSCSLRPSMLLWAFVGICKHWA